MGNVACCCSEPINFDGDVDLYHFNLHRAVGKGAFGKVRLPAHLVFRLTSSPSRTQVRVVEHKKSKNLYALKYMEKARCIKQKAVANIIQERRLLEEVRLALSARLPRGSSPLASNNLRELRDLKPDNILLDARGHAHITDFNVAIHYSERRLHTSVAGSMAYMAPEVIGRMGYTWCADWWSLGVVGWELLFHRRPFDGRSSEKMKHSILKDQVRLPSNAKEKCSKEGQRFILSLLDRNVKTRLACRDRELGIEDVRNHPWMAGIDWDSLEAKDVQPPFVPDMKKANFDVSHELDEFLMVEKPLTHQKRKQLHPDLEKMKPELRQLEEQFTLYDFSKNRRMSYYPHNQPITSVGHDETEPCEVLPSTTNTLLPTGTLIDRSQAGSPINEDVGRYTHPPIPSLAGHGSEDSGS
ncbi:Serine/threonine-protein kinase 32C [Trametes pubescens]|uniref:Serine/threonine-protein kinase 32C n=1 Tax=Trametes pubescens TaxID=154538 RepID=A0A1M2W596_TRAPU|nr:Serine/threonine-protein kinase 32C [Trametes pubescens]